MSAVGCCSLKIAAITVFSSLRKTDYSLAELGPQGRLLSPFPLSMIQFHRKDAATVYASLCVLR